MIRPTRALLTLAVLLAVLLPCAVAPAAAAAGDDQETTSLSGAGGLQPAEARRLKFLFWGYTAFWLLLAAYIVTIAVRLRGVRREIERLRDRMSAGPGSRG